MGRIFRTFYNIVEVFSKTSSVIFGPYRTFGIQPVSANSDFMSFNITYKHYHHYHGTVKQTNSGQLLIDFNLISKSHPKPSL
jgi:hypothetical protein